MDLVKLLKSRGHVIHTQTNGSRSADYYAELFAMGSIGISVHLDYARQEHIAKVVDAIMAAKQKWNFARFNWLCIRIMSGPGRVDEALRWHRTGRLFFHKSNRVTSVY